MAKPSPTAVGVDEWPLSISLWTNFCNSHGKYKLELNKYFHMHRCQLNFAMFCDTGALSISWQHLNHSNLLVRSVYRFHVYFHVRLILHDLIISLPHEDGFSKFKNSYMKSAYYSVSDDYGVNPDETWMHRDWFYMTGYGIFGHEVKATGESRPDSLTRWIITQSKAFTRKGIEKISRSMRTYVYLVLTFQVQTRSSTVGNSAPAADAQQVFKSIFKAVINEHYSIGINIERYQGVLEQVLSKVDFSVTTSTYMIPSDLNLSMKKTKEYNNKILVSNADMKIGSNKDHKKLPPPDDMPKIVIPAVRYDNPKMLTEKHNNEKLVIILLMVEAGLITYHFWLKINGIFIIHNR